MLSRSTTAACLAVALAISGCAAEISDKQRQDAHIQFDVGIDQLSKGNLAASYAALSQAKRLNGEFPDTHNALGLVTMSMGKYDDAIVHFQSAIELKPEFSDAHNNLGTVLVILGRYDEAIEHFDKALQDVLYATPSHAEGNKGYALYKKGDRDKAIKHIKNATMVNPKFCRGFMWLGEIYQDSAQWNDAERYLDRFVERCLMDASMRPGIDASAQAEVFWRLGSVTRAGGNSARAVSAFRSCLDAGKDTAHYMACDKELRTSAQ